MTEIWSDTKFTLGIPTRTGGLRDIFQSGIHEYWSVLWFMCMCQFTGETRFELRAEPNVLARRRLNHSARNRL